MHGESQSQVNSQSAGVVANTLRAELETRRNAGTPFQLREVVKLMVPLCTEVAELHGDDQYFFVHPSCIIYASNSVSLDITTAGQLPDLTRDRACIPPEGRQGALGDARASVFSLGAIFYEMVTGESVGPGMRRPSELVPGLPPSFEVLVGKALVAEPAHRPGDLNALAQALHRNDPNASIPPPPADMSHHDHGEHIDVDVSLSMMPPPPTGATPKISVIPEPPSLTPVTVSTAMPSSGAAPGSGAGATERLAQLKASLEADPRPRYVVVKDGMDHGPFSAVELLQQLATGTFCSEHVLRDTLSQDQKAITDWKEFAPFARQAKLGQEAAEQRQALEQTVTAEKKSLRFKAMIGGGVLVVVGAGLFGWWMRERAKEENELTVSEQRGQSVDFDGGIAGPKKTKWGGGPWKGGSAGPGGPRPIIPGGMSCEGAKNKYVTDYAIGGAKGPPDLTAGHYGAVLNKGTYLNACGVPFNMAVSICAAVQNGRAVGVTVTTKPPNAGIARCVDGQIRSMGFPANPRLDIAYTHFKASE